MLRSGGNERIGAPVICLFPRLNNPGSLRACSTLVNTSGIAFISIAGGVDTSSGMLTHDTKFHTLHIDSTVNVEHGPVECERVYKSNASTLNESSEKAFDEKCEVSPGTPVDDLCFVH